LEQVTTNLTVVGESTDKRVRRIESARVFTEGVREYRSRTVALDPISNEIIDDDESKETSGEKSSTESKSSLIDSLNFEDVSAFLPPGFNSGPEESKETISENSSAESKPSIIDSLKFEDVSAFLPPGFNPNAEKPEETTAKKPDIKLDFSSLLSDIKTDELGDLLPPDFHKPASTRSTTTTVESTTTRLGLKFPTRPGVSRKKTGIFY